jgi:hypothetical protein
MPDRATISRIAKILARAGSDNANEAGAALQGAYKRMARDGVTLRDLLSLPIDELYQDMLVKLVDVILADQPNLSPSTKREAYSEYMLLIVARFSGAWDGKSDRSSGNETSSRSKGQGSREEEAREYEERRAREESARGREEPPPPHKEEPFKQKSSKTPEHKAAYTVKLGKFTFSFSSASFFSALQAVFGRGSIVWHSLHDPARALRLFAACFLFGAAFAGIVLAVAAIGHALTHTSPLWDNIRLKNAFSFLLSIGFIWKARALHHAGWFR